MDPLCQSQSACLEYDRTHQLILLSLFEFRILPSFSSQRILHVHLSSQVDSQNLWYYYFTSRFGKAFTSFKMGNLWNQGCSPFIFTKIEIQQQAYLYFLQPRSFSLMFDQTNFFSFKWKWKPIFNLGRRFQIFRFYSSKDLLFSKILHVSRETKRST